MFRHLLVPTDGSDLSDGTIRKAVNVARGDGARITFLHVRQSLPITSQVTFYSDTALFDPAIAQQFIEAEGHYSQSVLDKARAIAVAEGVPCATLTSDNPLIYAAIIETAEQEGCDLIFMASHGRRGLAGLLLGSETQRVLTHANLPVLVYRKQDPPRGLHGN